MDALTDHFGESAAATYDEDCSEMFDDEVVARTVDVLADLARGGRALELGIGTGRIALPLAERGVPVVGIDMSSAMVERLHAKPAGSAIPVSIGDFSTTRVDGRFTLAYLVFNTVMNLTTQETQVACFANVAAHLEPGGTFVVECMVPELRRLPPGSTVVPFHVSEQSWGFDEYDVSAQSVVSHHLRVVDGVARHESIPFRYAWPAELDLMARMAGLTLRHRWADWRRTPFTHESESHISIWQSPLRSG